jgi:metal transporter CNNM
MRKLLPTTCWIILALLSLLTTMTPLVEGSNEDLAIQSAFTILQQAGIENLCDISLFREACNNDIASASFRTLEEESNAVPLLRGKASRMLYDPNVVGFVKKPFSWMSVFLAVSCVVCAAICAGLIMGILSLDELQLHIKLRAGSDPEEQKYAQKLLPLVQQRHLVLVSLLLLNFLADEFLPLCLDDFFPTWMAVVVSVVLVVFVSEIIPSAVFIGPNQLRLASKVSPFAYGVIYLMWPIAYPIAKLLDYLLHDEDEQGAPFNRGEMSALVRIQYEGRMAAKRRELKERRKDHGIPEFIEDAPFEFDKLSDAGTDNHSLQTQELNILEGALNLQGTTAREVCTKLRKAYTIPHDMILDKSNVARIYGVGFSRVPVYHRNPRRPKDISGIIGILITRHLIILDTDHKRRVATLPLKQPMCVGPDANMMELLAVFQTGSTGTRGGHMAIVCERPKIGNIALNQRKPIPPDAGVIGIITLEDVIEELLQEPIYDEGDSAERRAMEIAEWAFAKWKMYAKRKRKQREDALAKEALESTPLLPKDEPTDRGSISSFPLKLIFA